VGAGQYVDVDEDVGCVTNVSEILTVSVFSDLFRVCTVKILVGNL
jgi:hypothetical protein